MIMKELFKLDVAKSQSTDDYQPGKIPFVTNTELNNGVVSYVCPLPGDKVFRGPAICISGLGHATIHFGEFLPKGNGGDSCTVLTPKEELSNAEILYYAALFNHLHGWRFSFGRKTSKRRLESLDMAPLVGECPIELMQEVEKNNKLMLDLLKDREADFLADKLGNG